MYKNDNEFIDGIWDKYNRYSKQKKNDKFFNKHQYKNIEFYNNIRMFSTFMIMTVVTFGMVYAGVATYNYVSTQTKRTGRELESKYIWEEMQWQNGFYYKKITNYNDYLTCMKIWDNLLEMTESDFEKYFVIITETRNREMLGIYFSDVSADSSTLYVRFDKYKENENYDETNTVTAIKIDKELDRDKVVIEKIEPIPHMFGYKEMNELPRDYKKEQAIEDNCFVIDQNEIISSNKNQLEEFIQETEKGNNMSIRIAIYFTFSSDGRTDDDIIDIEYKDGKYYYCIDTSRRMVNPTYDAIQYFTGTKITKKIMHNRTFYNIENNQEKRTICIIK